MLLLAFLVLAGCTGKAAVEIPIAPPPGPGAVAYRSADTDVAKGREAAERFCHAYGMDAVQVDVATGVGFDCAAAGAAAVAHRPGKDRADATP
jgi:hypothetical protein